jgi:hypothetical protein
MKLQVSKILIAGYLLLTIVSHANAQGAVDLSVSPPTGYLKVQPGGQATHTIVLENSGDQTLVVTPKIVDFLPDGKTGAPVLQESHSFPYFDFESPQLDQVTVSPQSKAQLSLHIVVPQDATNREYPLSVLFESHTVESTATPGVVAQVSGIIGSNIIVLVSDDTVPPTDLSIKSFQTSKIVDSLRSITFKPLVANAGYAASVASGSAQILNWQGTVIQQFSIKPAVVLGSSERELELDSNESEAPTNFKYKPLFLFGMYKIRIQLETLSNDTPNVITKSEAVFAAPVILIMIILTTSTAIFAYARRKR